MKRKILFRDEQWEVEICRSEHGFAFGEGIPRPSISFAQFRKVGSPNDPPVVGRVVKSELGELSDKQLCDALERALRKMKLRSP